MSAMVHHEAGAVRKSPLQQIENQPWAFMALALGAGLAAGLLLRWSTVRKGLKWYLMVRRFV